MKWISLQLKDGRSVLVNLEHVAYITRVDDGTEVHFHKCVEYGQSLTVRTSYEAVHALIKNAFA